MDKILSVKNLNISFPDKEIVCGVDLDISPGEMVALVGESGCGKTLLCRTLLALPPRGVAISHDSLSTPPLQDMSLIMQDALSALDPAMQIGKQILETREKEPINILNILKTVGIKSPEKRSKQYPTELSGGMRQRVAIAIALTAKPRVIFADEPTTSLDADLRLQIMEILNTLKKEGTAILFITHDLSLVRHYADRVLIMQGGKIIEEGKTADIFNSPQQEHTRELLSYAAMSSPKNHTHGQIHYHDLKMHSHEQTGEHSHTTLREPEIEKVPEKTRLVKIMGLSKVYLYKRKDINKVLNNLNLDIYKGELIGLCGPSGVGKSTLARIICGLENPSSGSIEKAKNLNIQMIFQDSLAALNPQMSVEKLIGEPLYIRDKKHPSKELVLGLMDEVELEPSLINRRPRQLSGGQRQRVAIARSIATNPDLLIADEPVSSLDSTTCSKIVHLLKKLRDKHEMTMLLISHDLHLLAHISDRIIKIN
jgi:peptide/nickel transport system ATP-binding protein